jgi:hypothetical protein
MIFTIIQASGIIFTMELTDENRVGFQSLLHSEGYDGSVCAGADRVVACEGILDPRDSPDGEHDEANGIRVD